MNALTIDVVLREAVSETGSIVLTLGVGEGDHLCWSRPGLDSSSCCHRSGPATNTGNTHSQHPEKLYTKKHNSFRIHLILQKNYVKNTLRKNEKTKARLRHLSYALKNAGLFYTHVWCNDRQIQPLV